MGSDLYEVSGSAVEHPAFNRLVLPTNGKATDLGQLVITHSTYVDGLILTLYPKFIDG